MIKVHAAYRRFLTRYGRMMRGASRMMDNEMQRAVLRGAIQTAFQAGFNTPRDEPVKPIKLKRWRGRNDPQ